MQVKDNRLSSMRSYFEQTLDRAGIDPSEWRPLFSRIVTDLLHRPQRDILLAQDTRLSESELLLVIGATKQLRAGEPIQYIIGQSTFFGLDILCDTRALIPRQETEELVAWILETETPTSILDIGTGTGCIALALKHKLPQSDVSAMDFSEAAIVLASENADKLDLSINFHHDDILAPSGKYPRYDLIVSNPPYVRMQEKAQMTDRVMAHEPHSALFVSDEDPLLFYRNIAEFAQDHLSPDGGLFFEINEYLGMATKSLLESLGFTTVEIKQDLNGKDRMISARLKP